MTDVRQSLLDACRTMHAEGLSPGTSGNLSAREAEGFWITPSGVPYDALEPAMMVFMDLAGDGEEWEGHLKPSSEWRFHLDIYRARPEVGGICHTHSLNATALATRREGIPAFHYMVAVAGGRDIRCAPYRTFGTQELSDAAIEALEGRRACLLANHGVIAVGATVGKALGLAREVETLAAQYILARQLGGPAILPPDEMDLILQKFRTYGQQK